MSELEELRELAHKVSRMTPMSLYYIRTDLREDAEAILDKYHPKPVDPFAQPLSEYLEWWESDDEKPKSSLDKFHEFFDHLIPIPLPTHGQGMTDMPPEFTKVINDNFDELVSRTNTPPERTEDQNDRETTTN